MASFMDGREIVKLAEQYGWQDRGPGSNHRYVLVKSGHRCVPVRSKLNNRYEAQGLLKQLGIPRSEWPSKLQ